MQPIAKNNCDFPTLRQSGCVYVDISLDDDYAAMLGYTEDELDRYFAEHMEAHRKVLGMTAEAYRAEPRGLRRPAGIACFGVGAALPRRRAWLVWPGKNRFRQVCCAKNSVVGCGVI